MKETKQRWASSIKECFHNTLQLNRTIEFDVTLGTFLPQLYYLDESWVKENINVILYKDNTDIWVNSFSSYLYYSSFFSKDLYLLLRENQHFKKAIQTKNQNSKFDKLPQQVCIAFLNDLESLSKGSLLNDIIISEDVTYLSDLVLFMWHLRGKLDSKMKEKIKPLWAAIVNHISTVTDESKYKDILAHLPYWLVLVDSIDTDIVQWIKISNKYTNDRTSHFYIDYLNYHASKTPKYVAEIFYDLLSEKNYFPHFTDEKIQEIVKILFENDQKEMANRICNLYLKSSPSLRNIFEKYNTKGINEKST